MQCSSGVYSYSKTHSEIAIKALMSFTQLHVFVFLNNVAILFQRHSLGHLKLQKQIEPVCDT